MASQCQHNQNWTLCAVPPSCSFFWDSHLSEYCHVIMKAENQPGRICFILMFPMTTASDLVLTLIISPGTLPESPWLQTGPIQLIFHTAIRAIFINCKFVHVSLQYSPFPLAVVIKVWDPKTLSGGPQNQIIFFIILRYYLPFSRHWYLHWWCKRIGG